MKWLLFFCKVQVAMPPIGNMPSMKHYGKGTFMPATKLLGINPAEKPSPANPALGHPEAWTDEEFREAFESLKIPNEMFHHREHIRLAWIYSCKLSQEEALTRIVKGIRAFAKHHGAPGKYHHTITVAWMRLVWHAARHAPAAPDFQTFAAAHPDLFHAKRLDDYYSAAQLKSDAARSNWIEPDLQSLP